MFAFYVARFKNYRNSYLLKANIFATVTGLSLGVQGTKPIFWAYLYNRNHLAPGVLDDDFLPEYKTSLAKKR